MAGSKPQKRIEKTRLLSIPEIAEGNLLGSSNDDPELVNPNPVLRIDPDGKVLFANDAGRVLLKTWGSAEGRLPSGINQIITGYCSNGVVKPLQLKCGARTISFSVVPSLKRGSVNLFGFDITPLLESEENYHKIVETAAEGIIIASSSGKLLFVNQRFADLLGYEKEELLGRNSNDFIYDRQELIKVRRVRQDLKEGGIIQKEMKFRRKDGTLLWTLFNASPLFNSRGSHIGNLAMHTDITGRKKIEEELKRSEQLYRAIGESIDYGIWICDAEGRNVYASKSFLNLLGITQEQCSEFGWGNSLHKDDAEKTIAAWKACSRTGAKWDIEHRFVGVDGKWHPILARGIPIRDEKGDILMWAGINLDISSIKEAQEELRKGEEKYRNLVRLAPSVIYEMNLKGTRFLSVNDTMCKILGYSREELLTIRPMDLLDDPDKMVFKERIRRKIHREEIKSEVEYRIKKKTGEYIHALINIGNVTFSEDNEPEITVVAYDITERKKKEEALKESEKRFKELVKNAPSAIYEIDFVNRRFTSVNDTFCIFTGYSRDEALSMDILDLLTPESRVLFQKRIDKVKEGGRIEDSVEYQVVKKDGSLVDTILNMTFNYNKNGEITGAMVVGHDITARKKVESNFREAQSKLNIALENGNIGIWEWDLKTDVVLMDERTERMFGLKAGTFGKTYNDFEKLIHEEDLVHFNKATEEAITRGIPLDTIFRLRPTKNNTKYLKSKALILNDSLGNPLKFSGVCIDVTGLKEGTEHLAMKLNEELLRSNKELERFAYVASHDLQEPLRMVSSFTQMLQQRYAGKLDPTAHDYIRFAVEGAKRMHDQINGLLEYSRINTKGRAFSRVNMNQVVSRVKDLLQSSLIKKELRLTSENLPPVIADEAQMLQLFQNLLSNSIKFSRKRKNIHIGYQIRDNMHEFSVKDEGIGIEEQYFDRIFEIFQRLMPRDEYEGTGIGLSICKRIVERHNGKIWVQSRVGVGSVFYFSLPQVI